MSDEHEPLFGPTSTELDPFDIASAIEEPTQLPPRVVLYGPHGIGKTTLAAGFPNPIFLFTERGERNQRIRRFPKLAETFSDATRAIGSLLNKPHDRQTFVMDTIDWFEAIVWAETCVREGWDNIESPGYGKGYAKAEETWVEFLRGCDALRDAGMCVVLLGHSEITKFTPPDTEPYNRYDLAIHSRARAKVHEWADVVGFCYERTSLVQKVEGTKKDPKVITRGGANLGRAVALQRKPTHEAKNGYGLPAEIPMPDDGSTASTLLAMISDSYR
jgi:hypothetical protein